MAAAKTYSGRLAFDPETGFHVDPDGKEVVTEDAGKTWRYATDDDMSHIERYQERVVGIDSTANRLAELTYEHGHEKAEKLLAEEEPHHFEVQPDDAHADGIKADPDPVAATITSHTDAPIQEDDDE